MKSGWCVYVISVVLSHILVIYILVILCTCYHIYFIVTCMIHIHILVITYTCYHIYLFGVSGAVAGLRPWLGFWECVGVDVLVTEDNTKTVGVEVGRLRAVVLLVGIVEVVLCWDWVTRCWCCWWWWWCF